MTETKEKLVRCEVCDEFEHLNSVIFRPILMMRDEHNYAVCESCECDNKGGCND